MKRPLVILNVVGLSPRHFATPALIPHLAQLKHRPMKPTFPAVTCSVQASLLSGKPPCDHGIIANGYFDRDTYEVKFWEQQEKLVQAPRLWDLLPGKKTAVLFWQNSMFIQADIVVTPRPLHLDSGLVQWCYSKPVGYYERLAAAIGPFQLQHYWGPAAGLAASRWIADAAKWTWRHERPDLLLVYLPHLDYASQKLGPNPPAALREVDGIVGELLNEFQDATVIVCSEYALTPVTGALYPNRQLRAAGLLRVREIAGKEYLDFELSDAFAIVDHQVAHIYCKPGKLDAARAALPGVEFTTIAHPRAGELVAIAPKDKWFAYYWWDDWEQAPEFAFTVDIHRKPGYDPCEMWFDYRRTARTFKLATGTDPTRVKGSHGRVDEDPRDWAVIAGNRDLDLPECPGVTDVALWILTALR
jgi:predicted AlkP superfamily pyrophosphatase or phosphodiesterase